MPALYSPATTRATLDPVLATLQALRLPLPSQPLSVLARGVIARTLRPVDLKRHAAFVNTPDEYGRTPLRFAVEVGSVDVAHELLMLDADVNALDANGTSALHVAAATGDYEMVDVLLLKQPDLEAFGPEGTPLLVACAHMNWTVAMLQLLTRGVSLAPTWGGKNALHLTVERCSGARADVVARLCKGIDVNAADNDGNSPLHTACRRGVLALVDQLVTLGALVDVRNAQGETPLMLACLCAVAKPSGGLCAKLLLDRGCNCNLARADGKTASQIVNDLAAKDFTLNESTLRALSLSLSAIVDAKLEPRNVV